MPAIKDNLKSLRNISGLSQNEVADMLNVTRQTISSYETGRTEPDWDTLKKLADLYKVDVHDVLYGGNRQQRKIKRILLTLYIVSAVFLVCLLVQSVLFLISNTYFSIPEGTVFSGTIEKHSLVYNIGDRIALVVIILFRITYLVLIYPILTIRSTFTIKKLTAFALILLAVMTIIPLPFMLIDKISGFGNYYFPIIEAFPGLILFYLVLLIAKIADKSKSKHRV